MPDPPGIGPYSYGTLIQGDEQPAFALAKSLSGVRAVAGTEPIALKQIKSCNSELTKNVEIK
jgi:hypothetical protein